MLKSEDRSPSFVNPGVIEAYHPQEPYMRLVNENCDPEVRPPVPNVSLGSHEPKESHTPKEIQFDPSACVIEMHTLNHLGGAGGRGGAAGRGGLAGRVIIKDMNGTTIIPTKDGNNGTAGAPGKPGKDFTDCCHHIAVYYEKRKPKIPTPGSSEEVREYGYRAYAYYSIIDHAPFHPPINESVSSSELPSSPPLLHPPARAVFSYLSYVGKQTLGGRDLGDPKEISARVGLYRIDETNGMDAHDILAAYDTIEAEMGSAPRSSEHHIETYRLLLQWIDLAIQFNNRTMQHSQQANSTKLRVKRDVAATSSNGTSDSKVEDLVILHTLGATVSSQVSLLLAHTQATLVVDLREYLKTADHNVKEVKEHEQKLQIVKEKKSYDEMIGRKIFGAMDVIRYELAPEMELIAGEIAEDIKQMLTDITLEQKVLEQCIKHLQSQRLLVEVNMYVKAFWGFVRMAATIFGFACLFIPGMQGTAAFILGGGADPIINQLEGVTATFATNFVSKVTEHNSFRKYHSLDHDVHSYHNHGRDRVVKYESPLPELEKLKNAGKKVYDSVNNWLSQMNDDQAKLNKIDEAIKGASDEIKRLEGLKTKIIEKIKGALMDLKEILDRMSNPDNRSLDRMDLASFRIKKEMDQLKRELAADLQGVSSTITFNRHIDELIDVFNLIHKVSFPLKISASVKEAFIHLFTHIDIRTH